ISRSFVANQKVFPFTYIHTHKHPQNGKDIVSILFIDKNLQVTNSISRFSQEMKKNKIMREILKLQDDFQKLHNAYNKKISNLKENITNLKISEEHKE
ncbi:MAG: hypothetical protein ACTSWL_09675, partial [Promethearchaeota archaeon]